MYSWLLYFSEWTQGLVFVFQRVMTFHEHLLDRLSISEYTDHFVLKGRDLMYAIYALESRPKTDIIG